MQTTIKNMKLRLSAIAILVAGAFLGFEKAHAGFLIEPYLGYGTGTSTFKSVAGVETSGKESGVGFGARVGYSFLIPFVAFDYSQKVFKFAADSSGLSDSDDTFTEMSVVVGANLPIVRVFAGYGFDASAKIKGTSSESTVKGTFTKVGVGFKVIPMVAVNLEYFMYSAKKIESGGAEYDFDTFYSSWSYNPIFLSVSVPF